MKSSRKIQATDEEIQVANILLQTIWSEQDLGDKTKDLIDHALTKTFSAYFLYYDPKYRDTGEVRVEVLDPFDLYLDPMGELDGARFNGGYIIRTTRMTIHDLERMKNYDPVAVSKIKPDAKISESDWKARHFQGKGEGLINSGQDKMIQTAIIKEFYHMVDGICHRKTWCHDSILQEDTALDIDEYPFYFYQAERRQGRVQTKAWVTPLIELNKILNRTVSKLEEWMLIFATGRILQHKNSTVDNILSDEGQIIEYTGTPPQYWQMGSPGEVPFTMASTVERYIEDNGIHGESLGRLAGSASSGVAIAQLQASDLQNLAEPVENLKSALEDLAVGIFKMASKSYSKVRKLYEQEGDEPESFEVKGADAVSPSSALDPSFKQTDKSIKIHGFDAVSVDIIPGSAFSDMQARQDVIELRKLGIRIPDEYILSTYGIGNTADLVQKFREELNEDADQKSPDQMIAEGENQKMMMGGKVIANPSDDHRAHLAIHGAFLEQAQGNPEVAKAIQDHMRQHEALMNGAQNMTAPELL